MSEKRVRVQSRCLREVWRGRFNDTSFATINELENAMKPYY